MWLKLEQKVTQTEKRGSVNLWVFVCVHALRKHPMHLCIPSKVCLEEPLRRQTLSIKAMGGSCKNLIQADKESRVGEKTLPFILLCSLIPSPYTWLWLIFLKSAVTSSMPRRWTDPPLTHKYTHTHTPYTRRRVGSGKAEQSNFPEE